MPQCTPTQHNNKKERKKEGKKERKKGKFLGCLRTSESEALRSGLSKFHKPCGDFGI
jgi:hypothetical protein